ncbi:hypothetical protein AK812_SmicGene34245 [Symbiodinium microadriaticum]|uniref:Uncharacterized protein n=1 Tax=Symbiodinium microadriaticum TaxID=2951 RepID=A0A1Q9CPH6_SYMMI|nr:hypothetical protein AK812_SmicGene34245 [Symbiodinium microadriaticum]
MQSRLLAEFDSPARLPRPSNRQCNRTNDTGSIMEQLEEEQEAQLLPKKYAEHQAVKEQLAGSWIADENREPSRRVLLVSPGREAGRRLYCIPRNAEQCVEIQVREGSRQVRWDWVGPNFGKVGCKYISICRSLVTPGEFYCAVPYDAAHVLLVNIDEDTITEVGEKVSSDLVTKYATAAQPLRAFDVWEVLQIDPYTGTVGEVGPRLVKSEQAAVASRGKNMLTLCLAATYTEGEWWVTIASPIVAGSAQCEELRKLLQLHAETLKIYAIPWVMEIDPVRGGATRKAVAVTAQAAIDARMGAGMGAWVGGWSDQTWGPHPVLIPTQTNNCKYCSAIVAGDGSIFAPPYNARKASRQSRHKAAWHAVVVLAMQILRIDGTGNVSPTLSMCQGANRLLYVAAWETLLLAVAVLCVLEISTSGKGNRLIGPAIGNGEAKYACAALGPDDKIYCAPLEAHRVLLIIPEDHEVEEIGVDLGKEEEKYSCIAPAPVGPMMYAAPRNARFLLEVDTKRCFVREVGKDLGPVKRKFTAILTGKPPEAPALVRSGTAPQRGAGASWSPPSSRSKQRTPPQDQKAVEPRSKKLQKTGEKFISQYLALEAEAYRAEVRGFLSDQGTERGIASFPVGDSGAVHSTVAALDLGQANASAMRCLPLFHRALQIPGTLHIIFNCLEFSVKQIPEWQKFERQLSAVTRICTERSWQEVIKVKMMRRVSTTEKSRLQLMDQLLDWRWDSLACRRLAFFPCGAFEALLRDAMSNSDIAVLGHLLSRNTAAASRIASISDQCNKVFTTVVLQKVQYTQELPRGFCATFAGYMGQPWHRVKEILKKHIQTVDLLIEQGQMTSLDAVTHELFGPTTTGRCRREFVSSAADTPLHRWPHLFRVAQEYAFVSMSERHTEREHVGVNVAANRGLTKAGPAIVCCRKRQDQVLEMIDDEKELTFLVKHWKARNVLNQLLSHQLSAFEVSRLLPQQRWSRLYGYAEEDHFKDVSDNARAEAIYRQAVRDQAASLVPPVQLPSASFQVVHWLKGHLATGTFVSVSKAIFRHVQTPEPVCLRWLCRQLGENLNENSFLNEPPVLRIPDGVLDSDPLSIFLQRDPTEEVSLGGGRTDTVYFDIFTHAEPHRWELVAVCLSAAGTEEPPPPSERAAEEDEEIDDGSRPDFDQNAYKDRSQADRAFEQMRNFHCRFYHKSFGRQWNLWQQCAFKHTEWEEGGRQGREIPLATATCPAGNVALVLDEKHS